MDLPSKGAQARCRLQESLRRNPPKAANCLGLYCLYLSVEVRQTSRNLFRTRLAVSWRAALDDIRDEAFPALKPDGRYPFVQVQSGSAYEGPAGPVFLLAWTLPHEHDGWMLAPFPWDGRFSSRAQAALDAGSDLLGDACQVLGQSRSGGRRCLRVRRRRGPCDNELGSFTGKARAQVVLNQVQRLPQTRYGFHRSLHRTPFPGTIRAPGQLHLRWPGNPTR